MTTDDISPGPSQRVNGSAVLNAVASAQDDIMLQPVPPPAPWMSRVMVAAGVYNLLWGSLAILAPAASLRFGGLPTDKAVLPIWQCLGMVIGVYGVGYWISARDPFRHWLIIFVGLLGKVLGPIGYVIAVTRGELPVEGMRTLLTNDLIWWVPFSVILWKAAIWHDAQTASPHTVGTDPLHTVIGNTGKSLFQLSQETPVLVVLLRHSGCTFCREALSDIGVNRAKIEATGTKIALVHLSAEADIAPFAEKYGVGDLPRFADPDRQLYREFDLAPGGVTQLLGLKVWWRGMLAALQSGHGFGGVKESMFQMPGTFLIENGQVLRAYRHDSAADRPDYTELACPLPKP